MKAERKYLAHYLDASFGGEATDYVRLGKDLESYAEELNPDVETKKNILGENSVVHNGYEASSDADPFYYEYDDALSENIMDIAMNRLTGDACKTTKVDVLLKPGTTSADAPTVIKAWREDVLVIPTSVGGDTSGVQTPFGIHNNGNRVEGTFDLSAKKFTPNSTGL
ncbi:MAG: hypothetical protein J6B95_08185 [Oscillospiraceae bacterium]|nr:hypothetical protein [Oscillospiraceae bacterium]